MTTGTNKLTDTFLRSKANPQRTPSKPMKYADGGGLFALHTTAGALIWKLKFRVGGAEQLLTFGTYPAVSLADARQRRDDAKALIAQGIDPRADKAAKLAAEQAAADAVSNAPTFRRFAQAVLDALPNNTPKTKKTWKKWDLHLGYAMDHFGDQLVGDIYADQVLTWLTDTFGDRLDTLRSVKQKIDRVMRKAAIAREGRGPFGETLRGEIPTATKTSFPAITDDPKAFGALLRKVDSHRGDPSIRAALQFQALTFQRPGMIYAMTWDQVDFVNAVWAIPAEGMKGPDGKAQDHLVPLSAQALAVLNAIKPISGWKLDDDGHPVGLVFPGRSNGKPMSANSLNMALDRLGYRGVHCPHGFRASATTMLLERLGFAKALIDVATAHAVKDPNGGAYNRAQWIDQRVAMFARWGDYCDELRAGKSNVHAFKAVA